MDSDFAVLIQEIREAILYLPDGDYPTEYQKLVELLDEL